LDRPLWGNSVVFVFGPASAACTRLSVSASIKLPSWSYEATCLDLLMKDGVGVQVNQPPRHPTSGRACPLAEKIIVSFTRAGPWNAGVNTFDGCTVLMHCTRTSGAVCLVPSWHIDVKPPIKSLLAALATWKHSHPGDDDL